MSSAAVAAIYEVCNRIYDKSEQIVSSRYKNVALHLRDRAKAIEQAVRDRYSQRPVAVSETPALDGLIVALQSTHDVLSGLDSTPATDDNLLPVILTLVGTLSAKSMFLFEGVVQKFAQQQRDHGNQLGQLLRRGDIVCRSSTEMMGTLKDVFDGQSDMRAEQSDMRAEQAAMTC